MPATNVPSTVDFPQGQKTNNTHHINFEPTNRSIFMKLPQEIRQRIYQLLMSDRNVYITARKVRRSGSRMTVAREANFQELSNSMFPIYTRARPSKNSRVSLCILRVSRKIYDEARRLPYTHNTFHMEVETLEYFMEKRTSYQKLSLRSLSLKIEMSGLEDGLRCEPLMIEAAEEFTELKDLKLLLDVAVVVDTFDQSSWIDSLRFCWRGRKLETAQVKVECDFPRSRRRMRLMMDVAKRLGEELTGRKQNHTDDNEDDYLLIF